MIILAAAASLLTACSVAEKLPEEELKTKDKTVLVKFTTQAPETKTAFGEHDDETSSYPTLWTGKDQHVAMSMNLETPVEADVIKDEEISGKADFSASFSDTGSPYRFYALSPLSAASTISESRDSWAVTIPTVQTPKADGLSCDEAAMLLYAKTDAMESLPTTPIGLRFSHITTYCRLALKNLGSTLQGHGAADASVKSIDLTYSVPVTGDWYVSSTDGSISEKETSHTVTIQPTITDLSQPTDIWFAIAPCCLDGVTVKVSVNTDKGRLSREFTYGTRTYEAGCVNKVSVDMSKNSTFDKFNVASEETVYQLVNSMSDLSRNDEVIFVDAKIPTRAMTATTNSASGLGSIAKDAAKGFTYSSADGYIRLPEGSSVVVMTVSNKQTSSLTFMTDNQYLNRGTSNNTHYLTLSSSNRAFTADISNGNTTLSYLSNSKVTTYSIYYNNSYFNIFSSTSSQTRSVALYKKVTVTQTGTVDPEDDPILEKEEFGAYTSASEYEYVSEVMELSREYLGSTVTFAILSPFDEEVVEFSGIPAGAAKGDSFDLVVTKINGKKHTALGTYNVTVLKEEGAKLWLSDMGGNGFIVKR